jgi:hypothetical protein
MRDVRARFSGNRKRDEHLPPPECLNVVEIDGVS